MAEKKITKKDMFNKIMAMVQDEDVQEFCKHEIELLEKKSGTKSKKELATDAENTRLMGLIVDVLKAQGKPMTVSEIMGADAELGELSNQKVSALTKKLHDSGVIKKDTDKRKSVFSMK